MDVLLRDVDPELLYQLDQEAKLCGMTRRQYFIALMEKRQSLFKIMYKDSQEERKKTLSKIAKRHKNVRKNHA